MSSKKRIAGLNPISVPSSLRKSPVVFTRSKVLKMLAIMEQSRQTFNDNAELLEDGNSVNPDEFLSTGRTGRRNALPDILSEHVHVTSSDLPARLQALTTKDSTSAPSKSGSTSSELSNNETKAGTSNSDC